MKRPTIGLPVLSVVCTALFVVATRGVASRPPDGDSAPARTAADLAIETTIDGLDASTGPGPAFAAGSTVTVVHVIHNTGDVDFAHVELLGADPNCVLPGKSLLSGESMSCSYETTVEAGSHAETIHAVATPLGGGLVTVTQSVHSFGAAPDIDVELYVAGEDADYEPGPYIPIDQFIELHYVVTNTGNMDLQVDGLFAGCSAFTLAPGQVQECFRHEIVGHDQNVATATARGTPDGFDPVVDQDPAYYYGAAPGLYLRVRANDMDAETAPGPMVDSGAPIEWSFEVSNTGNLPGTITTLRDTHDGTVMCPHPHLDASASMVCTASSVAEAGSQPGFATAVALFPGNLTVTSATQTFYFGAAPGIRLEVLTNGLDADTPPGPELLIGTQVTTTYVVHNTGNVELSGVTVSDERLGPIDCAETALLPGAWTLCAATGTVEPGPVSRTATVTGVPPAGPAVQDDDSTHYTGTILCLFDCNGDGRTDLEDFAEFMLLFSGP